MRPVLILQRIAAELDHIEDVTRVHDAMDEVEFVFDLLDPERQDLANDLMVRLERRLALLKGSGS